MRLSQFSLYLSFTVVGLKARRHTDFLVRSWSLQVDGISPAPPVATLPHVSVSPHYVAARQCWVERPRSQTPLVILGTELVAAVVVRARRQRAASHRGQCGWGAGGVLWSSHTMRRRTGVHSIYCHIDSALSSAGRSQMSCSRKVQVRKKRIVILQLLHLLCPPNMQREVCLGRVSHSCSGSCSTSHSCKKTAGIWSSCCALGRLPEPRRVSGTSRMAAGQILTGAWMIPPLRIAGAFFMRERRN